MMGRVRTPSGVAPSVRHLLVVVALMIVVVTLVTGVRAFGRSDASEESDAAASPTRGPDQGVEVFHRLGVWIDIYDFRPDRQSDGVAPVITPGDVPAIAATGTSTVLIQAADQSAPGVADEELVGRFLRRSHAAGMNVVAWYLPTFDDLPADWARLQALIDLEVDGHRFDGIAVDIEDVAAVPDPEERTRRLLRLSEALAERVRSLDTEMALGAVVPAPVLLEDVNPDLWPGFPWAELDPHYDAWLVMNYWTGRREDSGWRDAYRYTITNVLRLRDRSGDPDAPIHIIGGIGDEVAEADAVRFAAALQRIDPIGASIYDLRTTSMPMQLALERWNQSAERRRSAAGATGDGEDQG
jgi:hypothetical protein